MTRIHDDAGISLVEMLVAMVLVTFLGAGVSSVMISASHTQKFGQDVQSNMDQARIAHDQLQRDLRVAVRVYGTNPQGVVSSNSVLALWIDKDEDGIQDLAEQITYRMVGTGSNVRLERYTEASPTPRVLARKLTRANGPDGLPGSSFVYNVAPPDTTTVTTTLTVDAGTAKTVNPFRLVQNVRLRNAP